MLSLFHAHTLGQDSISSPFTYMCLEGWSKPENPEEMHMNNGRTCGAPQRQVLPTAPVYCIKMIKMIEIFDLRNA